MSRTRGGALLAALALTLAAGLAAAAGAGADKYEVAQCGWRVGDDADWSDSTGGSKFRHDAWCVPPSGSDTFDGVHMKSLTKGGHPTVAGTGYARWRWEAPPGTGITHVSGTWWHTLHDGFEQRIGTGTRGGGFDAFAVADSTDTTLRGFSAGFSSPRLALEDRLLCARGSDRWCDLSPASWSGVRALTITIEDDDDPDAEIDGGSLVSGGWRRGNDWVERSGEDEGSGIRHRETRISGLTVGEHEYSCHTVKVGGDVRGTRMRPCDDSVSGRTLVNTRNFGDGAHEVEHCVTDFAGSRDCTEERTVRIDNHAPAQPRSLALAGGDGWRRADDFDVTWENPDQDGVSPIAAAGWRITGPAEYDTGEKLASGEDIEALRGRAVPGTGIYVLRVWLRDEAGNSKPASAAQVRLRLDGVPPGVGFDGRRGKGREVPEKLRATASDEHSGVAGGRISYRPLGGESWHGLETELAGEGGDGDGGAATAKLAARVPGDLDPGVYVFRVRATDRAGNAAESTRRADGTEMVLRKPSPPGGGKRSGSGGGDAAGSGGRSGRRRRTRLRAGLHWRLRRGSRIAVPFGARPRLFGRLVTAAGAGLAGRRLRVVSRAGAGARRRRRAMTVRTGEHGGFRLTLPPGTSRRLAVGFGGAGRLAPARRTGLSLRVRGAVSLAAKPRALRTGGVLHLRGRVRSDGAAPPRRGKLVTIQYYESEAERWRPVLVVRADRRGRFRARYRFRYVAGTSRIRLRALVPAEARWPYASGASRPVPVTVRGLG